MDSSRSTAAVPIDWCFADGEEVALAGFLAGAPQLVGARAPDRAICVVVQRPCVRLSKTMADFRETIIYRWLAAGDAGDLDAFDDLLLPDAVIHAPRGLSTTSREAEKAVWQEALAAMPDLRHDVQEVLVGRDIEMARIVVTGTMAATFAGVEGSGRSFQMDQAVIAHLRDGRIAEAWEIADVAALERQVTQAEQAEAK